MSNFTFGTLAGFSLPPSSGAFSRISTVWPFCAASRAKFMPEVLLNVPGCFSVRLRAPRTGSIDIATYYMAKKAGATDSITLTGGCAKNQGLKTAIERVLKLKVVDLAVDPQLMTAESVRTVQTTSFSVSS